MRRDDRAAPRREDAIDVAARALRYRDLSKAELDHRLERRGVDAAEREAALAALERAGVLADDRAAAARADALVGRGHGDASIRVDLERRGYGAAAIEAAVAGLRPEEDRARELIDRRGATLATARRLAARGFAAELIEELLAASVAEDGPGALP